MVVRSESVGPRPAEVDAAGSVPRRGPRSSGLLPPVERRTLCRRPSGRSDVKPLVVGNWGTTPGAERHVRHLHLHRVVRSTTWTCSTLLAPDDPQPYSLDGRGRRTAGEPSHSLPSGLASERVREV
jgi:hypothetical protein